MNTKAPVSERALLARINRKLAHDHEKMFRSRQNTRAQMNLGDFYIIDTYRNAVVGSHLDIGKVAKEIGVLAEWEALVGDGDLV